MKRAILDAFAVDEEPEYSSLPTTSAAAATTDGTDDDDADAELGEEEFGRHQPQHAAPATTKVRSIRVQ